ncbi:MAG: CPBP family intramembrane glutamic endopeptidase [Candidatus Promineifilaceae bacterium]|nr:CPBP family intramembrane glutamic endopeptidase [Candidatus Promineifilaceae bacterium]
MSDNKEFALTGTAPMVRVILALLLPVAAAVITGIIITNIADVNNLSQQSTSAVLTSSVAVVSWILGLRWYGARGLGLRGGRPLYAGIGFAALGWVIFLVLRLFFVDILTLGSPNSARTYLYLLLFESFTTQIWTFGLLFHAVADWRGPLTAAITSGIVFGLVGSILFQEAYVGTQFSIIYLIIWGILYGVIRLRTGSLLGTVLIQSLQSFSAWVALSPYPRPNPGQLQSLYVSATIAYTIVIWRLWPKHEDDYRV